MQISAINSVNFGNNYKANEPIETSFVDDDTQDVWEKHEKVVNKARSDVSPLTCIAGIASGLFALKKGSKLVSIVRSAVAKGADEILGVAKKITKKELPEKLTDLTDKFGKPAVKDHSKKVLDKFTDVVDSIFGEGKAEKVADSLKKNDIYLNGKSLFDNATAAVGAIAAMDVVSDVTEENIDNHNIQESAQEVKKHYDKIAKEIALNLAD